MAEKGTSTRFDGAVKLPGVLSAFLQAQNNSSRYIAQTI